jgi:TM2 domain-containing membrane protein YozV
MVVRTRATYILLGIFLGGLGIHNFYAGRTAAGVIQLLIILFTGWMIIPIPFVWLWVILELLLVTRDGWGNKLI